MESLVKIREDDLEKFHRYMFLTGLKYEDSGTCESMFGFGRVHHFWITWNHKNKVHSEKVKYIKEEIGYKKYKVAERFL